MMMMIALVEIEISGSAWRDRDEVVWSAALHIVPTCTLFYDDDDDDDDDDADDDDDNDDDRCVVRESLHLLSY